jgi:hypothetical protein
MGFFAKRRARKIHDAAVKVAEHATLSPRYRHTPPSDIRLLDALALWHQDEVSSLRGFDSPESPSLRHREPLGNEPEAERAARAIPDRPLPS